MCEIVYAITLWRFINRCDMPIIALHFFLKVPELKTCLWLVYLFTVHEIVNQSSRPQCFNIFS